MRKTIFSLTIMLFLLGNSLLVFSRQQNTENQQPTSIGMVIYSNDIETIWNAFRLANYSKNQNDTVSIFLLGKGLEVDDLVNENED